MRPPFAYFGGKAGSAETIVTMIPPHRVYMEPFFGSGAVFFAKPPSRFEIINDLDDSVVTFFRVLRAMPEALEEVCTLTPHARTEFERADLAAELDDLERARRFWVRINQSFAKTHSDRTGWSITTARTQSVPASIRGRIGRFAVVAERLMDTTIECCDAADLIDRLATGDTVIYADPPYVRSVRRRGVQAGNGNDYRQDMTDDDHRRLAEALRATPAFVILSGYPSPLYEDLYHGWCRIDRAVTAFSSNSRTNARTGRVESIWTNRPVPQLAMDFG
jgi:DNA adenine methylase